MAMACTYRHTDSFTPPFTDVTTVLGNQETFLSFVPQSLDLKVNVNPTADGNIFHTITQTTNKRSRDRIQLIVRLVSATV